MSYKPAPRGKTRRCATCPLIPVAIPRTLCVAAISGKRLDGQSSCHLRRAAPFHPKHEGDGALLLTLSAVTPASSVFVIVPGIVQQAGTGAFISMAAAALVALAMAFVYAELASAFPLAGGEYALMGRTLGPFVGFVFMGMNTVGSTLGPAVLSLGASTYVAAIWPGVPAVPLAIGIIAAAMLIGILNIRLNAWVTGAFLGVECLSLIVLAVLGFTGLHRGIADLALHPVAIHAGHLAATPIAAIGLATAVAIFSYNGFGSAVYFSEEMQEAPSRVARTILFALALTVAFEFIPMTAVLLGAGPLASHCLGRPVQRLRSRNRRSDAERGHEPRRGRRHRQRGDCHRADQRALFLFQRTRPCLERRHQ